MKKSMSVIAAVGILLCVAFVWGMKKPAGVVDVSPQPLGIDVSKEVQKLVGDMHPAVGSDEKADLIRNTILRGEYDAAHKMIANILAESKLLTWKFYPFNTIIKLIPVDSPAFESCLTKWIRIRNTDPFPYLLRAQVYQQTAWQKRGERFVEATGSEHMKEFTDYMEKAAADVSNAIRLNPDIPFSYYLKIAILDSQGNTTESAEAFQEGVNRYPNYYWIYSPRVEVLAPKWGGSVEELYSFVNKYVDATPKNSPLRMLYLDLYATLLDAAQTSCYTPDENKAKECTAETVDKYLSQKLKDDVVTALELYNQLNKHEFDALFYNVLSQMIEIPGADAPVGQLMQQAARIMGSDNQLMNKNPGHNNFVLDVATADIWAKKKCYDNAEKKYKEALEDLKNDPFSDEESTVSMVAEIYYKLAQLYASMSQYSDVIVYNTAADVLSGNVGKSYLPCEAYFKLRHYGDALRTCTTVIDNTGNELARKTRVKIYELMGKQNEALSDLAIMADSESGNRTWAAVEMSIIYGNLKEAQKDLDGLNKYSYLYDERHQTKEVLAFVYNNRCYAEMQLGQLKAALDDCNASLRFGNIPDAYQKQQELVERLQSSAK